MVAYRKVFFLKIADIWFSENRDNDIERKCDFAHYHDAKKIFLDKDDACVEVHYKTLITDIKEPEEEIIMKFKSKVRNEIRRAIKDNISSKVYTSKMLLENRTIIKDFDNQYSSLCKQKNMKVKSEASSLFAYAEAGALVITVSYNDDKIYSYHVYITDNKTVRLLHSVSAFREASNNSERTLIGRANRMLHYNDMLYFKKQGYSVYDWGGYSQKDELKSIADFKAGFGGQIEDTHRYLIACNPVSKFVMKVNDFINYKDFRS